MKNNFGVQGSGQPDLPAAVAAEMRADAVGRSNRPEEFWSRQRRGIQARIAAQTGRRMRHPWRSLAAAAAAILAVVLMRPSAPPPQKPLPPTAAVDADQELLLAVERSLSAGTPASLAPVALLVEPAGHERSQPTSTKEQRHEN